jgi:hypothetical protein
MVAVLLAVVGLVVIDASGSIGLFKYRVIHKSLRDFRPLRYSNRDVVNRGRDTTIFCPTLQVLDMSTLGDAADVKFSNFGRF